MHHLLVCLIFVAPLVAVDEQSPPHRTWEQLLADRWAGAMPADEEFGDAHSGIAMHAVALRSANERDLLVPVVVTLRNVADHDLHVYRAGWCFSVKPAGAGDAGGLTRAVGIGENMQASHFGRLPAAGSIRFVAYARPGDGVRQASELEMHVNVPNPAGMADVVGGPVYDHAEDLISQPFPVRWVDSPEPELAQACTLLQRALDGDAEALVALQRHAEAVPALERALCDRQVDRRALIEFVLANADFAAEHLVVDHLCADGPWGGGAGAFNNLAWHMVECGTANEAQGELALALAEFGMRGMRDGSEAHCALDTYAAVLAQQGHHAHAARFQRLAYEACPEDPAQRDDIGGRVIAFEAAARMPVGERPPIFGTTGYAGGAARDHLLQCLQSEDAVLARAARALLARCWAHDPLVTSALVP